MIKIIPSKDRLLGLVRFSLFYMCLKLVSLVKISYILGSHVAFFSAVNILYPLGGLFLGVSGSCLWFVISSIVRLILGAPLYLHLIHGIPGFCAALYMARSHIIIRFFMPLVCMIFFILHPIGFQAAPYSFYWLIPILLYFVKRKSFFVEALCATFVAHAVGSVFWLYLVPMPVEYWWSLIPIVALERFSFATGSVFVYSCSMYCLRRIKFIKLSKCVSFNYSAHDMCEQ